MYKLVYRAVNADGRAPRFSVKAERGFPSRGTAEHRAEALEAQGCIVIRIEEELE